MQSLEDLSDLISIPAAAQHLQVGRQTVHRWVAEGRLSVWKIGPRTHRVSLTEVLGLVAAGGPAAGAPGTPEKSA